MSCAVFFVIIIALMVNPPTALVTKIQEKSKEKN